MAAGAITPKASSAPSGAPSATAMLRVIATAYPSSIDLGRLHLLPQVIDVVEADNILARFRRVVDLEFQLLGKIIVQPIIGVERASVAVEKRNDVRNRDAAGQ